MEDKLYEMLVVGSGPAGLSAAINGRVRNKEVLVVGGESSSPRLAKAPRVDNFLGSPGLAGADLRDRFLSHAREMEVPVKFEMATAIYPMGEEFSVQVKGDMIRSRTVILATGVAQTGYLPGERELLGRGVGYCATCDGPLYRNKDVAVLAFTPEAREEANFLAEICDQVYYLPFHREKVSLTRKIRVVDQKLTAIAGTDAVTGLQLGDELLPVSGVFIIRPVMPMEQLAPGLELREGTIRVERDMSTNIPGLFAAGDCTGNPFQLAKAVGEGLVAAFSAVRYLDRHI